MVLTDVIICSRLYKEWAPLLWTGCWRPCLSAVGAGFGLISLLLTESSCRDAQALSQRVWGLQWTRNPTVSPHTELMPSEMTTGWLPCLIALWMSLRLLAWQIMHAVVPCAASLPSRSQSQRRQPTPEQPITIELLLQGTPGTRGSVPLGHAEADTEGTLSPHLCTAHPAFHSHPWRCTRCSNPPLPHCSPPSGREGRLGHQLRSSSFSLYWLVS